MVTHTGVVQIVLQVDMHGERILIMGNLVAVLAVQNQTLRGILVKARMLLVVYSAMALVAVALAIGVVVDTSLERMVAETLVAEAQAS